MKTPLLFISQSQPPSLHVSCSVCPRPLSQWGCVAGGPSTWTLAISQSPRKDLHREAALELGNTQPARSAVIKVGSLRRSTPRSLRDSGPPVRRGEVRNSLLPENLSKMESGIPHLHQKITTYGLPRTAVRPSPWVPGRAWDPAARSALRRQQRAALTRKLGLAASPGPARASSSQGLAWQAGGEAGGGGLGPVRCQRGPEQMQEVLG